MNTTITHGVSKVTTARAYKEHYNSIPHSSEENVSLKFLQKQEKLKLQHNLKDLLLKTAIVFIALFITFQLVRGTFFNVDRFITLNTKISNLESLNKSATYQNTILKRNFKNYTSAAGLESLARDYLNLVGENEISVVIKKSI